MITSRTPLIILALALAPPARAAASDPPAERAPCPALVVSLGVLTALPALLETGQTLGADAGLIAGVGPFVYGVRASVSGATEHAPSWRVSHTEVRLRALAGVRAEAGRGTWILRLGAGVSLVSETRERHDASEIEHADLPSEDHAFAAVPAIELEGGLVLRVAGAWGLALFGGPSLHFGNAALEDGARLGWTASGALVWTP